MTALFYACDAHNITNPANKEEVESAIGVMTEEDASPLFIVNGEVVPDISHINSADIESVRIIKGSNSTEFSLRNALESIHGQQSENTGAYHTGIRRETESRQKFFRGAESGEPEAEGIRMIIRDGDSEPGQGTEVRRIIRERDSEPGLGSDERRVIIRDGDSEPGQGSDEHRIIRKPYSEQSTGQRTLLRNSTLNRMDGNLEEKLSAHPNASNGIVIINLRGYESDTSDMDK